MTKRYKKDKNIKIKPYILIIVTVFLIGTLIYSGYHIVEWKINNDKNKKIKEEVSKSVIINDVENKEQMNINFNELKQQNSDIIAWLK